MSDFPILSRQVHGKRLVYLDNAATTQKPRQVLQAMNEYYERHNANVARGVHVLGEESTALYEEARQAVADFLNADPRGVVFTSGATEGINTAARWAEEVLQEGDEILLSSYEHHANIVPWQEAAAKTDATIKYVGLTEEYEFDLDDYEQQLSERTRFVCVSHASNVLGTIAPLKEIVRNARGAYVIVDGAQAAGHLPVDLKDLGVDAYAFSAHKMLGPMGTGVLALSGRLVDELKPFRFGGGMIQEVRDEKSSYAEAPHRFEAGTPNVAGAVGLKAAIDYLGAYGLDRLHAHEQHIAKLLWERLSALEGVTLYGPPPAKDRVGIVSFDVQGVHPHDLAQVLDSHGVAVRSGMHCAMPLHRRLGIAALNRASTALYNKEEDVDEFIEGVKEAQRMFTGDADA